MSNEPTGLYRLGGLSLIGSGILFLARYLLEVTAGPPPSIGEEIVAWAAAGRLPLAWVSEVLFFATALLVPAVIALYASLAGVDKTKAAVGCGIVAMAIALLAALLVVHGRLVFPVYGLVRRGGREAPAVEFQELSQALAANEPGGGGTHSRLDATIDADSARMPLAQRERSLS